jgi:hypothetical protein
MIWADSFLLHRKSKTPPEKGGVFTSLDGLRRIWTLSQLNKYTSEAEWRFRRVEENPVARGLAPVGSRSAPKKTHGCFAAERDGAAIRQAPSPQKPLCQGLALCGLGANDTTPIVIGRAPFADVFDMAKTPKADLLLIQPTHAAAR